MKCSYLTLYYIIWNFCQNYYGYIVIIGGQSCINLHMYTYVYIFSVNRWLLVVAQPAERVKLLVPAQQQNENNYFISRILTNRLQAAKLPSFGSQRNTPNSARYSLVSAWLMQRSNEKQLWKFTYPHRLLWGYTIKSIVQMCDLIRLFCKKQENHEVKMVIKPKMLLLKAK